MEDSLKGALVTATIITLFITCIISFITIFPQEQGIVFTDIEQSQYLAMADVDSDAEQTLTDINNQSQTALDQWDITEGFMGSNTIKQSTKGGVTSYSNNIFANLKIIATQVFGANSPVLYAIGVFLALTTLYIVYLVIKFVRTGS